MAAQHASFPSIEFSIASSLKNVRLMEVPDEVSQIIIASKESGRENPAFKFKSGINIDADTALSSARAAVTSIARGGILHLCSTDKAWAIKQVSTSNSVYLIQPSAVAASSSELNPAKATAVKEAKIDSHGEGNGHPNDNQDNHGNGPNSSESTSNLPRGSVTAIAQVRNFLELHATKIDEVEVARSIFDLVPVYQDSTDENDRETLQQAQLSPRFLSATTAATARSLEAVVDNIAAPDGVIVKICALLSIFEIMTDNGKFLGEEIGTSTLATERGIRSLRPQCYLPSPTALLNVWSKIIEGSAIELIRLDHALDVERIIAAAFPTPSPNMPDQRIARVLLRPGGTFDQLGLVQYTSENDGDDSAIKNDDRTRPDLSSERSNTTNIDGARTTTKNTTRDRLRYLKPIETTQFIADLILRANAYKHHFSSTINDDNNNHGNDHGHSHSHGHGDNDNDNENKDIESENFIAQWTNLVPSSFVKYCTINQLRENHYSSNSNSSGGGLPSIHTYDVKGRTFIRRNDGSSDDSVDVKTKIKIRDLLLGNMAFAFGLSGTITTSTSSIGTGSSSGRSATNTNTNTNTNTTSTTVTATTTTTSGKRKWHEKFGAQRNLKK